MYLCLNEADQDSVAGSAPGKGHVTDTVVSSHHLYPVGGHPDPNRYRETRSSLTAISYERNTGAGETQG